MTVLRNILLAVCVLFMSAPASAVESPTLDDVMKRATLRVGMSGSQPPFNFKTESGELAGLEVELAQALATIMGVEIEFVTRPFGKLLQALDAREIDIVMSGMTITPERTRSAAFVGPYVLSGKSFLTRADSVAAARAGEIRQLDVRIAALSNSTSLQFAERALPLAKVTTVEDYDAGVNLLLGGDVDVVIADMPICLITVIRRPGEGLWASTEPLTLEPIGIAVPANDMPLRNLLDNYLRSLNQTGYLLQLKQHWIQGSSWIDLLP